LEICRNSFALTGLSTNNLDPEEVAHPEQVLAPDPHHEETVVVVLRRAPRAVAVPSRLPGAPAASAHRQPLGPAPQPSLVISGRGGLPLSGELGCRLQIVFVYLEALNVRGRPNHIGKTSSRQAACGYEEEWYKGEKIPDI